MIESERDLRASYGHDVECAWLVLDAVDALGDKFSDRESAGSWAKTITDFAIKYGFDENHGGFYSSGEPAEDSDDLRKSWWVQSEASVAMLNFHKLTGESRYRDIIEKCFTFTMKNHIAPARGWWDTLEIDGSVGKKDSNKHVARCLSQRTRSTDVCKATEVQLSFNL